MKKEIIEMRDEIAGLENEWYDSGANKEIMNKLFEKKVTDKTEIHYYNYLKTTDHYS